MIGLLTYGHGTDSPERTVATLRYAAVASLVDIRTAPGSRRNPQFARASLAEWLPEDGLDDGELPATQANFPP